MGTTYLYTHSPMGTKEATQTKKQEENDKPKQSKRGEQTKQTNMYINISILYISKRTLVIAIQYQLLHNIIIII